MASPNDATQYTVTITSAYGCIDTSSVVIDLVDESKEIRLPLAFSPNANNRNDRFRIIHPELIKLESFSIYNRFGEKVFSTTDPDIGWDGIYNNEEAPVGVYSYYLKGASVSCGREIFLKGNVTLIR
jgi:gliding motility-associated-like protein